MESVEYINWKDKPLAYIIRKELSPKKTTFLTPLEFNMQVGFVAYPAGGEISRHLHHFLERRIVGTSEVLIIRKGRCEVDIYNDERQLIATRDLQEGDIIILVCGGHGFRMSEDTVFIEVKQGPYIGQNEKERF